MLDRCQRRLADQQPAAGRAEPCCSRRPTSSRCSSRGTCSSSRRRTPGRATAAGARPGVRAAAERGQRAQHHRCADRAGQRPAHRPGQLAQRGHDDRVPARDEAARDHLQRPDGHRRPRQSAAAAAVQPLRTSGRCTSSCWPTLGSTSYSAPVASNVELEINGKVSRVFRRRTTALSSRYGCSDRIAVLRRRRTGQRASGPAGRAAGRAGGAAAQLADQARSAHVATAAAEACSRGSAP